MELKKHLKSEFSVYWRYTESALPCSAARQRLLIECFRRAIIIAARSNASHSLFSAPHSSWSLAWNTERALGLFFISSQTCSIGLKSGGFAGQRSTRIPSLLVDLWWLLQHEAWCCHIWRWDGVLFEILEHLVIDELIHEDQLYIKSASKIN